MQNIESYNRLQHETSPYLKQHASNPVDWFPWGKEALEKARIENKPIIVSVGYAACRWCHVMAHESFENQEIAEMMNKHFVCIKVDREERPDIDAVYMNAVQLISGRGGWPLNCFALPNARPFWGGTYFRPEQWKNVLEQIAFSFEKQPEKFSEAAEEILHGLLPETRFVDDTEHSEFRFSEIENAIQKLKTWLDFEKGGFRGAPKFPMPSVLNFLLDFSKISQNPKIEKFIHTSVENMYFGGIYDHVGGGFARYSTDENWFAPHFEKMLYDNAQLLCIYSKAFYLSNKPLYKEIVYQTIDFCENELMSPEGLFYSSKDAESEGEEGLYYVWKKEEINTLLGADSNLFCEHFDISETGNWENGTNILHIPSKKILPDVQNRLIQSYLEKLKTLRKTRIAPQTDDKIITSWNALMISAYCTAYKVFDDCNFKTKAVNALQHILNNVLSDNYDLFRISKAGNNRIPAFLDDYAFLANALIDVFEIDENENHLHMARRFADEMILRFYSVEHELFYFTSVRNEIVVSNRFETEDNVIASSNSVAVSLLRRLAFYFSEKKYENIARRAVLKMTAEIVRNTGYYSNWALQYVNFSLNITEIIIVGEHAQEFYKQLKLDFFPGKVIAFSTRRSEIPLFSEKYIEGKTGIYICENNTCGIPVFDLAEFREKYSKLLQF